ncbi:germinal-center associated nuclear protein-like [Lytechinus pictus]|uniref:germinal-center associated nuclear protein-like n=1 Tax=Lytechinus pictus TaxID=7653 RepID=UPI0030B9BA8D
MTSSGMYAAYSSTELIDSLFRFDKDKCFLCLSVVSIYRKQSTVECKILSVSVSALKCCPRKKNLEYFVSCSLREVQQYRPEVRNSEAVVFAIKVSAAFSSNNYCRFFKLIRVASFLNACILHRYFVQLRCLALETMNKAFTTPKGTSMFPTAELVHLLAFEDDEQASNFCECHGLGNADGCIQLSRGGFIYPEEAITSQRAPSVIEAKNDQSVGEVVNNGPLPLAPPHTPISSFDVNGRLLDRGVEDKTGQEMAQPERKIEKATLQEHLPIQQVIQFQEPQTREVIPEVTQYPQQAVLQARVEETKPIINQEVVKDITKELFLDVIDEMIRDLSIKFMDTLALIQATPGVLTDLIDAELRALSHCVAMETLEEERYAEAVRIEQKRAAEEASRKEKELNALKEEACRQITEEILDEIMERTLEGIIEKEISEYEAELRRQAIERCSFITSEEILLDLVMSEVNAISNEVITIATAERDKRLAEIEEAYRLRQLNFLYQKWCRAHAKRVKIRRALETFPAGPPSQNTAEQLEVLWPKRREHFGEAPSPVDQDTMLRSREPLPMSLSTPYGVVSERESLAKHIMQHHYLTYIRQQRAWQPLDLPVIYKENTCPSQHASNLTRQDGAACRYWKVVSSLPQGSCVNRSPCSWLKAKLRRGQISKELRRSRLRDNENVETLSLFTQRCGSNPLGICTRALMGLPEGKDTRYQLMGSSGIILVVEGESQACLRDAQQRLNAILSHIPKSPSLPVLVCVISDEDVTSFQSSVSESLKLPQLTHEGVLSSWRMISIPWDIVKLEASQQLEEGIGWLVSHHPKPPAVVCETVKEYLDNGLSQFFSINVNQLSKQRKESGLFPLSPQSIVSLYNCVISHLSSVAGSSSLSDISWPPTEFTGPQHPDLPSSDWNSPSTLSHLHTIINNLKLPDVPSLENSDWLSVSEACIKYVNDLPGRNSDKAPLLSRVRWLLDKSRRTFEDTCFMTFDTEGCEPSSQHAPWVDILEECVTYMMTTLSSGMEENQSSGNQLVYFHQSELGQFEFPIKWKQEMNETLEESVVQHESMFESIVEAVSTRRSSLAEEELNKKEERRKRREEKESHKDPSFLLPEDVTMTISRTSRGLLRRMLDKEREESNRFEAMLTSFLEEPDEGLQQRLHVQINKEEPEFRLQLPPFPKASLSKSVEDHHPMNDTPIITLEESDDSLSDQINSLKERLASEKQEALMAEMRLNALLGL